MAQLLTETIATLVLEDLGEKAPTKFPKLTLSNGWHRTIEHPVTGDKIGLTITSNLIIVWNDRKRFDKTFSEAESQANDETMANGLLWEIQNFLEL